MPVTTAVTIGVLDYIGTWNKGDSIEATVPKDASSVLFDDPHWQKYPFFGGNIGNADSCTVQWQSGVNSLWTTQSQKAFTDEPSWTTTYTPTSAGEWRLRIQYAWDSGANWTELRQFSIPDAAGAESGTHGAGKVIALKTFEQPQATHVVWQTYNGDLVARRGPY